MDTIKIYCDGACRGNGKTENVGGWGAVLIYKGHQKEIKGSEINTTNNRMELLGCIKALEELKLFHIPIEIYTDSAYLCNCMNDKWYIGWRRKGWLNSQKKPVENRDLWERLLEHLEGPLANTELKFNKVAGHSGDTYNELADKLCNEAMDELLLENR